MNFVARMALSLGCFVSVGALLMLFLVKRGTAEFVITCITLGLGLITVLVAIVLARWSIQRPQYRGGNE